MEPKDLFYGPHRPVVKVMLQAVGRDLDKGYKRQDVAGRLWKLEHGIQVMAGVVQTKPSHQIGLMFMTHRGSQLVSLIIDENGDMELVIHEQRKRGSGSVPTANSLMRALLYYHQLRQTADEYLEQNVLKGFNFAKALKKLPKMP
jgi:hypothetical protein